LLVASASLAPSQPALLVVLKDQPAIAVPAHAGGFAKATRRPARHAVDSWGGAADRGAPRSFFANSIGFSNRSRRQAPGSHRHHDIMVTCTIRGPLLRTQERPRNEPIYERAGVKRGGAEFASRGSRTSSSPSASVDLAHLRPLRGRLSCAPRKTSSEPEAEGDCSTSVAAVYEALTDVT